MNGKPFFESSAPQQDAAARRGGRYKRVMDVRVVGAALVVGALSALAATGAGATPGSGITPVLLGSGVLEDTLKMKTNDPANVTFQETTVAPNGTTGWHDHHGPHLVLINSGEIAVYDEKCHRSVYGPGDVILHQQGEGHVMRNEGTENVSAIAVSAKPVGESPRIDLAAPQGCPVS